MPERGKAAVLFTGGKDSILALHLAAEAGWTLNQCVTFAPPEPDFLAHPLPLMRAQAGAMGLPHVAWTLRPPLQEAYAEAFRSLREEQGIDAVVTGDIALVDGHPNWVRDCAEPAGLQVITPLWQRDRDEVMEELLRRKFKVMLSCVKTPWFSPDWAGRILDAALLQDMKALRTRTGLDLCGENGEYHTMVLDAPLFNAPIDVATAPVTTPEFTYLRVDVKGDWVQG